MHVVRNRKTSWDSTGESRKKCIIIFAACDQSLCQQKSLSGKDQVLWIRHGLYIGW